MKKTGMSETRVRNWFFNFDNQTGKTLNHMIFFLMAIFSSFGKEKCLMMLNDQKILERSLRSL